MSNYTPTTAEVSAAYIQWSEGWSAGGYTSEQEASEEFNRWLSGRIRKAQEKAWAEGVTASDINLDWQLHLLDHNPYAEE